MCIVYCSLQLLIVLALFQGMGSLLHKLVPAGIDLSQIEGKIVAVDDEQENKDKFDNTCRHVRVQIYIVIFALALLCSFFYATVSRDPGSIQVVHNIFCKRLCLVIRVTADPGLHTISFTRMLRCRTWWKG